MKKVIATIVFGLLWCNISFAEIQYIERDRINVHPNYMYVTRICVDGYEYVTLTDSIQEDNSNAITGSITQSFEIIDGKSLPKKCK